MWIHASFLTGTTCLLLLIIIGNAEASIEPKLLPPIILPPIIDSNETVIIDPPFFYPRYPWIHMKYYFNDECQSSNHVNYMFGVRGGEDLCLQDLEFLSIFVPNDNTTHSYRFIPESMFGDPCSSVRLQRYFDHYCMDIDEEGTIVIGNKPDLSTTDSLWFGKCFPLWNAGSKNSFLQYTCSYEIFPPEVSKVNAVSTTTFVNPSTETCNSEVATYFSWYRYGGCVSLDGLSSMYAECIENFFFIPSPSEIDVPIDPTWVHFKNFSTSNICEGEMEEDVFQQYCIADFEEERYPTFAPTAIEDALIRKMESEFLEPTFSPTMANFSSENSESNSTSTPDDPSKVKNRLHSVICLKRDGQFDTPVYFSTQAPSALSTPTPPPTRQIFPILQMKFGFIIGPSFENAAETPQLSEAASNFVCETLQLHRSKCICGNNCLTLISKETNIILQSFEYQLQVEVDVSVNIIDFPEFAANHTALYQNLTGKYNAVLNDPNNAYLKAFVLSAAVPYFDYFYGFSTSAFSPATSFSFVQLPPTYYPTVSPTTLVEQLLNTESKSSPIKSIIIIGIVVGIFGWFFLLLFGVGCWYACKTWNVGEQIARPGNRIYPFAQHPQQPYEPQQQEDPQNQP